MLPRATNRILPRPRDRPRPDLLERAHEEQGRGNSRGGYDNVLLALESALHDLKPKGLALIEKLAALDGEGRIGAEVPAFARASEFKVHHDRGITDMHITYMPLEDGQELFRFLELLYRSLRDHGVALANDPRPG